MIQKTPMDILRELSPEGAEAYMQFRAATMEDPRLQVLDMRQKLLIGVGVAAALQSSRCALMWARQAVRAGVSPQEIVEAILVSRLMKAATVNDAAAETLDWLARGRETDPAADD
ncbi:MAG: hypothetical protein Kow00109_02590 [Acidobacteriota bacterium]